MRIAFLISRNIYFKIFGSIIEAALRAGHNVFCLHDYSQPQTGPKGYQFPLIEQTPNFANGRVISLSFQGEQDFLDKTLQNNIEVLLSLNFFPGYFKLREKLQEKGIFWAAVQCGFDSGPVAGEYLSMPDRFFIYSLEWLKWIFEYLKSTRKSKEGTFAAFERNLREKVKSVGFWEANQKNIINPEKVREKYGIPQEKKVVLFLPFPFDSSQDKFWTHFIYGLDSPPFQLPFATFSLRMRFLKQVLKRENDQKLCQAVRSFCDRNNAYLLVKSRLKDPVKNYLAKIADRVLYDQTLYPATITECFSIADICFNFYSTAALEAITFGVPNVCIAPDVLDWKDIRGTLWQTILEKAKDFFDFPGASYLATIPEIIRDLPKKTFSDFPFNNQKQAQYLKKFADGNARLASEKIILELEKMIKEG